MTVQAPVFKYTVCKGSHESSGMIGQVEFLYRSGEREGFLYHMVDE